jgi:low affinity Fe/Cu permease
MSRARKGVGAALERLSQAVSQQSGTSQAFLTALLVVLVWAALGPVFGFSDTWQLVINTGTTIVTFLMVFLIQRSQNKEARALELKLDEIVAALEGASNRLIDVEDLSEEELEALRKHYRELAALAKKDASLTESHSIEEAANRHAVKSAAEGGRPRARRGSKRSHAAPRPAS